jgi:hypothetical protein
VLGSGSLTHGADGAVLVSGREVALPEASTALYLARLII